MALERTLLAWVRTAAALIGFGFTIFHFFEAFRSWPGVAPPRSPHAALLLGVTLVAIGTLAMVLALAQYLAVIRYLDGAAFQEIGGLEGIPRFRPGLIVALVVAAVGAITLWALVTRLPW
jgi:inner membrane protein YidH